MTRARDKADGARLDAPLANPTFTGSFTFTPTSSIPASPTEGMMYYESDEDTIMVYGGTNDGAAAWFPLTRKITGGAIKTYTDTNNYRSHTFRGSGTFYTPVALSVQCLLVGGGGGSGALGGGGGAGQFHDCGTISVSAGAHAIQIGTGGGNAATYGYIGEQGGITVALGYYAYGGGGGGSYNGSVGRAGGLYWTDSSTDVYNQKGSGGGGGNNYTSDGGAGGGGGTGGNAGGAGANAYGTSGGPHWNSGGGGGAGAAGTTAVNNSSGRVTSGDGGIGLVNRYQDGTDIYYAGGGGGYNSSSGAGNEYGGGGTGHVYAGGASPGVCVIRYQI